MGAAVNITRTDHTAAALRGLAAKSNDAAQVRRLLALALILEGRPRREAAEQAGMDRQTLPIRLTHTPTIRRVLPVAGIKLGIGRRLYLAGDAEQRAEGIKRVEATVEAKRKFVEVGL